MGRTRALSLDVINDRLLIRLIITYSAIIYRRLGRGRGRRRRRRRRSRRRSSPPAEHGRGQILTTVVVSFVWSSPSVRPLFSLCNYPFLSPRRPGRERARFFYYIHDGWHHPPGSNRSGQVFLYGGRCATPIAAPAECSGLNCSLFYSRFAPTNQNTNRTDVRVTIARRVFRAEQLYTFNLARTTTSIFTRTTRIRFDKDNFTNRSFRNNAYDFRLSRDTTAKTPVGFGNPDRASVTPDVTGNKRARVSRLKRYLRRRTKHRGTFTRRP